MSKIKLW